MSNRTSGRAYWPIVWPKSDNIYYGRVIRNYATYPETTPPTAGDNAFFAAIAANTLTFENRVGPTWASARVTYTGSIQTLEIEVQSSASVQLKIERVDNAALVMGNVDNSTLSGNTYYYPGNSGTDYPKLWVFGQVANNTGGVPSVPIRITLKNVDNNATYAHVFTPLNRASRTLMFVAAGVSTPPPATTTPQANGFLSYSDQGWSGADEKQIENSLITLKFKKSVGACPTWAALKSDGVNLINDQQIGPSGGRFSDKGVQWQVSLYAFPHGGAPYTVNGTTVTGTGANPVQGGDADFYPSPVLKSGIINTQDRGPVFCATVRGLLWNFHNVPGNMPIDVEWWLNGRTICYQVRVHVEERGGTVPEQRLFKALEQEFLCLYNIADLRNHVTRINGSDYNLRQGRSLGDFSDPFCSDGCWAGTYSDDGTKGVTYYTPRNSTFKSWQKMQEQGGWQDNAAAYLNASPRRNYDIVGDDYDYGFIILGSRSQAMTALASLPPIDQSFDFNFTNATDNSHQWWNEDAPMYREGGGLKWMVGTPNGDNPNNNTGRFTSPMRAWQASSITTLEFTMAVSGTSLVYLVWSHPGKPGQTEYSKPFTLNGDGSERVYTISTADPNWNGIISYVALGAANGTNHSAYIRVKRIRKI